MITIPEILIIGGVPFIAVSVLAFRDKVYWASIVCAVIGFSMFGVGAHNLHL